MEETCGQTCMNGQKDMQILASHIDGHEMVTSTEDFKNQVTRSIHFLNTSRPFSLATSVIAQWAHEQIDHGGRNGDYT